MFRFEMNSKSLKSMMEKAATGIYKKAALPGLRRVYFNVDNKGIVSVFGTDLEHYVQIRSDLAYNTMPGTIGIDIDDFKVITKMNGDIKIEDAGMENKVTVKCGKKSVSIPKYDNGEIEMPELSSDADHILDTTESWLMETLLDMYVFTSDVEDGKDLRHAFNFNTKSMKVEALDGTKLCQRSLENQTVYKACDNVMIHNKCVPVFKKILNKNFIDTVSIYQDGKYVKVEGKEFTYIIRRMNGKYFVADKLFNMSETYRFSPDRQSMLSSMEYIGDLAKGNPKPLVIFVINGGKFHSYFFTDRYDVYDEIDCADVASSDGIMIGFNPLYICSALKIVDSEYPVCIGGGSKSPMIIQGNEYKILIMPVNIDDPIRENVMKRMSEN